MSYYTTSKRFDKGNITSQAGHLNIEKSLDSEELTSKMNQVKAVQDTEKKLFQQIITKHQYWTEENVNLRCKLNQICSENVRLKELGDNQTGLREVISVQCETEKFYEKLTETAQKRTNVSQNNVTLLDENRQLLKRNGFLKEIHEKVKEELGTKVNILENLKSGVNQKINNYETNICELYKELKSLVDQNKKALNQFESIVNYETRLDLTLEKENREREEIAKKNEEQKREMEKMYKLHCKEKEQHENTIRDLQTKILKEQSKSKQLETDVRCFRDETSHLRNTYSQFMEEELRKHRILWDSISSCSSDRTHQ